MDGSIYEVDGFKEESILDILGVKKVTTLRSAVSKMRCF
jgi:hypothetical protein